MVTGNEQKKFTHAIFSYIDMRDIDSFGAEETVYSRLWLKKSAQVHTEVLPGVTLSISIFMHFFMKVAPFGLGSPSKVQIFFGSILDVFCTQKIGKVTNQLKQAFCDEPVLFW